MVKTLLLVVAASAAAVGLLVRAFEARFTFAPSTGEDATPAAFGIPFEPATLRTRDGEQLRAWYMPHEHARALVLYFHGNGGNLSTWLPVLAGIYREGYAVAAFDYRGYGLSTGRPSERGLYRDVDAATAWAGQQQGELPLILWGRSLGTTMAAYASGRARPSGLILEGGFPSARSVLRKSALLAALSVFSSYRLPTARYARAAGCPVLVLHGDADSVIPFATGRALFDALPEPKRFEALRGADHNDLAPPDPERYWSVVGEFVSTLR